MDYLTKIWETIERASYKILIPATLTLAVLLFTPTEYADILGINKFSNEYKVFIGPAFLTFLAFLIVRTGSDVVMRICRKFEINKIQKSHVQTIKNLNPDEKGYLRPFIQDKKTSITVRAGDGIMGSLLRKKIVEMAHESTSSAGAKAFLLTQWAREILECKPELLDGYTGHPDDSWGYYMI